MIPAQKTNGFYIAKQYVVVAIAVSLLTLPTVGILCGFLARKTCPEVVPETTTTTTTTRTTTPGVATSTTTTGSPTTTSTSTRQTSTSTTTLRATTTTRPTTSTTRATTPQVTTVQTTTSTTRATTTTTTATVIDESRLPDFQIPVNYNLDIRVYFEPTLPEGTTGISATDRFEGRALIDFHITRPTRFITFHCDSSLKIDESGIELTNLNTSQVTLIQNEQHYYYIHQLYRIDFDNDLPVALYRLKLDYSGDYGPLTNLVGFYRTRYNEDGVIKQIAATKFQPTDARKAYPCFDEPGFKATFEISIEHPLGTIALSNWPESPRQLVNGNRYRTTFEKTYPMSSYLAAWTVAPEDFGYLQTTTQRGKQIRVFARKDAVNAGLIDFALEMTKKSLDFYENVYFDPNLNAVPPKIDMMGFPDFPSGAMEHWGIVGYRETSLLFRDGKNPDSSKQSVAFTIAHEIAHFWFGNLVTCKWWNDLWLNEGMARFLQFKAVQYIFPEWDVENQFLTLYEIPVMYDDGFETSQPVAQEVSSPAQINSLFTSITYDKGSSILRMLESTVGEENFRLGLNNFLRANEFSAAVAATFYNSLQLPSDMTGVTPQEYMENWLLQINYPEVAVVLGTNAQNNTRVYFLQKRFLLSQEYFPDIDTPSPFGYEWLIYLKCRAGGIYPNDHSGGQIREFTYFLNYEMGQIDLDRHYTWVKCNNDFRGYYVTDYSAQQFLIFDELLFKNQSLFTIADRTNLIHNAFALAYLGTKSYAVVSYLTNYFEVIENDYVPWRAFTWHITKIASLLEHRPSFLELKDFGTALARSLADRLDIWNITGSHVEKLFKNNIIDFLCRLQDESCLRKSTELFLGLDPLYFTDVNNIFNNIPATIRGNVYKYHIQNSYQYGDFFEMAVLYDQTVDPQDKSIALNALSFTRLTWIFDFLCYDLLAPTSTIRPQDFFTLTIAMSRNPSGRYTSWYFLRHRWYQIVNKFGLSSRTMHNAVKSMVETFENEFLLQELKDFFDSTNPGAGEIQRKQALEIVQHNIFWINDREKDLIQNLFEPRLRNREKIG